METKVIYRVVWTVTELAQEAGVSTSAVRQLLRAGSLKGQKQGAVWLVPDDEAKRWLNKKQAQK